MPRPGPVRARPFAARLAAIRAAACAALCACAAPQPPLALPFHVIAHRGASAYAPENTLPAYAAARELGAVEVELDIQLSSDDVLVLFHDGRLDRKTDRSGRVREHTADDLLATDIGTWYDAHHPERPRDFAGTRLNTLAELFHAFGPAFHYHLEMKSLEPELPQRLLDEVTRFELAGRVTVTSFSFEQLERARALDPDVPITYLVRENELDAVDRAADAGFQMVGIRASRLTAEHVRAARRAGLAVRAYGIKGDADMERAIALGANGMTTNWPERLIARMLELLGDLEPRELPPLPPPPAKGPGGPRPSSALRSPSP